MNEIIFDKYKGMIKEIFDVGMKYRKEDIPSNMPSIFIPGCGSRYKRQSKKILYIGKDTNGWDNFYEDLNVYNNIEKREDLIKEITNRATNRIENKFHIRWWRGGNSGFWDFIFKIQRKINKLDIEKIDKEVLENNDIITQTFAWGNCNIFQKLVSKDIKNSVIYNEINNIIEEKVIQKSRFKILKYMLDSFNPDIIVIFNWKEDISFIGEYIDKSVYEEYLSQNTEKKLKIEYYHLKNGQHLFWTYHPTWIKKSGGNIDYCVNRLYEFMKEENVL